ncbi:MAG TPA: hypothetical protein PLE54_07550 [Burkholderiaceae bacterium]|nr:hypothetical protein [Burkholderiaceae bacterium]HQR70440.1 hypothetical protein [Burkholderiaceae bacterium]
MLDDIQKSAQDIAAKCIESIKSKADQVNYTASGYAAMAEETAREPLNRLAELAQRADIRAEAERKAAAADTVRAIDRFAPSYAVQPWATTLDIEVGAMLRTNPGLVKAAVNAAGADQVPDQLVDVQRAVLRLPSVLSGATAEDQQAIAAGLTGGDLITRALGADWARKREIKHAVKIILQQGNMGLADLSGRWPVLFKLFTTMAAGEPETVAAPHANTEHPRMEVRDAAEVEAS